MLTRKTRPGRPHRPHRPKPSACNQMVRSTEYPAWYEICREVNVHWSVCHGFCILIADEEGVTNTRDQQVKICVWCSFKWNCYSSPCKCRANKSGRLLPSLPLHWLGEVYELLGLSLILVEFVSHSLSKCPQETSIFVCQQPVYCAVQSQHFFHFYSESHVHW